MTKGWAYTRVESSPIRHAKTRHRLFRLLIMAQRGNAYIPAESSRVESSRVQSSPIRLAKTRKRLFGLRIKAAREYVPTQSIRVQSSPLRLAKTRHLPYIQWLRAGMRAHRQRQVECHESCRVDSTGATCFVFVSRITGIGCDGCYFAFGNGCRKVILLVQVQQAICDASLCGQRKRPTVINGRTAQCSF